MVQGVKEGALVETVFALSVKLHQVSLKVDSLAFACEGKSLQHSFLFGLIRELLEPFDKFVNHNVAL